MPRRLAIDPRLGKLIRHQLGLVTYGQARAAGHSLDSLEALRRDHGWGRVLPGVINTLPVPLSRDMRLVAACLYVGPTGGLDAEDACAFHKFRTVTTNDNLVRVVVPEGSAQRSTDFVRVRRTRWPLTLLGVSGIPLQVVDPETAAVAAAARASGVERATAILAEAARRRRGELGRLTAALARGPWPGRALLSAAAEPLLGGTQTLGEARFRALAQASPHLPPLRYNWLLRLPDRRLVSPDALAPDAPLVHEINGHEVHAELRDDFNSFQERHDALVVAGLVVLHNSPERIRDAGAAVIRQVEAVYARERGNPLPPGVVIVRPGPPGTLAA